jgi:threonine/homoserine/homoserine lactone efflux protein
MAAELAAFAVLATLLIIAPGPDSLLVARNTVRGGRRGGLVTGAGTLTGLSVWAGAAALGLAALVDASRIGYGVLRLGGAGYLLWLGVAGLRARSGGLLEAARAETSGRSGDARGLWRMYAMGTLSNILNPKIGMFFVAFLPGFVPSTAAVGPTTALLGSLFVVETGLWLALLSWFVHRGARWLRRPDIGKAVERVTGVVLIGFGLRLATEASH